MYVRNCWYVAAWDYELGTDAPIGRMIMNEPIMVYRTPDGALVAMEDRCCHRSAPLSKGRIEGEAIRCMYHGLKFDRTGTCIEIPGQDVIPRAARVKTYPVVEKHSWIWVWMGEAAAADEDLIPPAIGFDDPRFNLRAGYIEYEANYQLVNDNLTDFTHLSYVHAKSFGTPEAMAYTRPHVERLDRGVRIARWQVQFGDPEQTRGAPPLEAEGDLWTAYDYLAPGILLMPTVTAIFPKGTAEALNFAAPPDLAVARHVLPTNFTSQAVTPITDTKTRYFYSWGPQAGEGSDEIAEQLLALANMAFAEDHVMIEAQQRIINTDPGRREVLTSADVGPTQMRSVLQRLIAAETGGAELRVAG